MEHVKLIDVKKLIKNMRVLEVIYEKHSKVRITKIKLGKKLYVIKTIIDLNNIENYIKLFNRINNIQGFIHCLGYFFTWTKDKIDDDTRKYNRSINFLFPYYPNDLYTFKMNLEHKYGHSTFECIMLSLILQVIFISKNGWKKYGLIHGDLHPKNVLVRRDEKFTEMKVKYGKNKIEQHTLKTYGYKVNISDFDFSIMYFGEGAHGMGVHGEGAHGMGVHGMGVHGEGALLPIISPGIYSLANISMSYLHSFYPGFTFDKMNDNMNMYYDVVYFMGFFRDIFPDPIEKWILKYGIIYSEDNMRPQRVDKYSPLMCCELINMIQKYCYNTHGINLIN